MKGDIPGWHSFCGVLTPDETVNGYLVRAQVVRGTCRARSCFRRVTLEPQELRELGLGEVHMLTIQRLWRCSRVEDCGLDFYKEPGGRRLTLNMLTGRAHVRIRVQCMTNNTCKYRRNVRVEEMIAGLTKRGQGGGATEVDTLAGLMTSACPVCKQTCWKVEVLWADTEKHGWRQRGEAIFQDKEVFR